MISENQQGFMRKRSTAANLFYIAKFIANFFDNHSQVNVIDTDLSMAFGKIAHGILLLKLDIYGFNQDLCTFLKVICPTGLSKFHPYQISGYILHASMLDFWILQSLHKRY